MLTHDRSKSLPNAIIEPIRAHNHLDTRMEASFFMRGGGSLGRAHRCTLPGPGYPRLAPAEAWDVRNMQILPNYAYHHIITHAVYVNYVVHANDRHPMYYYTHPLRNMHNNVIYANYVNYAVGTRPLLETCVGCQVAVNCVIGIILLFTPIIEGACVSCIIMQIMQIMSGWFPRLPLRPEH